MNTRRSFLKILGGGTIAAAAGAGAFVGTRTPAKALAPWSEAARYAESRKRILAHALLAPNPHNRQPWLVELAGSDEVILHRDTTRDLPMTDPFHRQIFVGLGCFIELMIVAASAEGFETDLTLFPQGDDGPVAHARFVAGGPRDPLSHHILTRRSCKEPYADTPIPQDAIRTLAQIADIHTAADMVADLRTLTLDALMTEIETPRTLQESVDLMRVGKSEINANPDGIDLGHPALDAMRRVGLLPNETLADTDHPGFRAQMEGYRTMMMATPAYAVLRSAANTRADQIKAGRDWLRLNLTTTALGLSLHPVSQALQEFDEMAPHYARAHAMLANPGETVQMLGRLGYGPEVGVTPRWRLETRMLNGKT